MNRILALLLTGVLFTAFSVPVANADNKPQPPKTQSSKAKEVTQAELAQLLVQALGLSRFLPAHPTPQQCFALLMDNSISPANGWNAEAIVTKADLARVIVQALKKQGDIKNPDDPKAWMDYLKGLGIPLEAVGETISHVGPTAEPVAPHVANPKVDPLNKRHVMNPIDETQMGVDMELLVRVLSRSFESKLPPLTQD